MCLYDQVVVGLYALKLGKFAKFHKCRLLALIDTGGGVYKVPIVVAYKVSIVVAYKVLNLISKKRSPSFGSRKVCL